jgi:UDP-N-acetyl-D-glucosamine dehydrogenase
MKRKRKRGTVADLRDRFERRDACIVIVGLGYVGLPLAVEFAGAGFRVMGVDADAARVAALRKGRSYVEDVSHKSVKTLLREGSLTVTADYGTVRAADAVIICVPTPLRKTKDPDLSFVLDAFGEVVSRMDHPMVIILESTTYPGTCEELILPLFEKEGFKVGKDFSLAFSPERVDPGNERFNTKNIPKIIGGITGRCTALATTLYRQVLNEVRAVSSTRVAEMAKLLENTFRSVNIAMANEMALMCRRMGINVWEVIDAAATKPFGFMPFYPGPGLGGHCLPVDPLYLTWKARLHDFEARLIQLASEINARMPEHVFGLVQSALNEKKKCLAGARVLLVGVAYKKDVGDIREAPALEIIKMLVQSGARVSYTDPYVPEIVIDGVKLCSKRLTKRLLGMSDCALIVTDHSCFDYESIVRLSSLVVDTRNATEGIAKRVKGKKVVMV